MCRSPVAAPPCASAADETNTVSREKENIFRLRIAEAQIVKLQITKFLVIDAPLRRARKRRRRQLRRVVKKHRLKGCRVPAGFYTRPCSENKVGMVGGSGQVTCNRFGARRCRADYSRKRAQRL